MERFHAFCESVLGETVSLRVSPSPGAAIHLKRFPLGRPMVQVGFEVIQNLSRIRPLLEEFLKNPADETREKIAAALKSIRSFPGPSPSKDAQPFRSVRPVPLVAETESARNGRRETGRYVRLWPVLDRVNGEYFGNALAATISWGRKIDKKRTRSIQWACYDYEKKEVRVNPVLDARGVPDYVFDFLVFHELLHAEHGSTEKNGRRRFHDRSFTRKERSHPAYSQATKWFKENLHRFFEGVAPPVTGELFGLE